jgi:hypothetical protein
MPKRPEPVTKLRALDALAPIANAALTANVALLKPRLAVERLTALAVRTANVDPPAPVAPKGPKPSSSFIFWPSFSVPLNVTSLP